MKITNFYENRHANTIQYNTIHRTLIDCKKEHTKTCDIPTLSFGSAADGFRKEFSGNFFKALLKLGVRCAYTGLKMISHQEYSKLLASSDFSGRSCVALRNFSKYEEYLCPEQLQIYNRLKYLSKRHPNEDIHELVQRQYIISKKSLVARQIKAIDELKTAIKYNQDFTSKDKKKINDILKQCLTDIQKENPEPDEEFIRKRIMNEMHRANLSSEEITQKAVDLAYKILPPERGLDDFFVKYSHDYKIKYSGNAKKYIPIDSKNTLLGLLKPSIASDEHIYPQSLCREIDENSQKIPGFRYNDYMVSILTGSGINSEKGSTLIDPFIKTHSSIRIPENIQKHIDQLIEFYQRLKDKGSSYTKKFNSQINANSYRQNSSFLDKLKKYIILIKNEFDKGSNIVKIDINKLYE